MVTAFSNTPQGGPATEALKVASKGFLDDSDGAEAGLLSVRMAGSNSLMRPRSQQFPPGGASTDSERCGDHGWGAAFRSPGTAPATGEAVCRGSRAHVAMTDHREA